MSAVLTTCPETGAIVHTGQHATSAQFETNEYAGAAFRCSACNRIHRWRKDEAWILPPRGVARTA